MKHTYRAAAMLLAACAGTASAQSLKPGLWEIATQMQGTGQGGDAMAQVQKQMQSMPPEQHKLILDSSVGRARVGCWRRVWVGATTLRANAREAEQRPRACCQRLNRVCSAVTQEVKSIEAGKASVHKDLLMEASGQLRNLG